MADQDILIKFSADTSELNKAIATTENQLDGLASEAGSASNATQKLQGGVDALKDSTTKYTKENRFLRNSMEDVLAATTGLTQEQARAVVGSGKLVTGMKSVGTATITATRAFVAMASVLTLGIAVAILLVVKNFDKLKMSVTNFTDKLGLSVAQQERAVAAAKKLKEASDIQISLYDAEARRLEVLGFAKDVILKAELKGAEIKLKALRVEFEATEALEAAQAAAANKRIERLSYLGVLINAILPKRATTQTEKEKETQEKAKVAIYEAETAILSINMELLDYSANLNAVTASTKEATTATKGFADQTEQSMRSLNEIAKETDRIWEEFLETYIKIQQGATDSGPLATISDKLAKTLATIKPSDSKNLPSGQLNKDKPVSRGKEIEDEKEYIEYLVQSLQFVSDLTSMIADARSAKIQGEIDDLNRLKDAELENAELTARQKERIEERYQKKIAALKTKQAQQQKRADITQAIINTALAITRALPNVFLAALAAATGAAQIAIIARQPLPKFKKGGAIDGKSHESGGVHIEAEGGEWIHSRAAVQHYGKDFMKDINDMRIPKSVLMPDLPAALIAGAVSHGIDHDRLGKTIGRELAKQPKVSIALDERGFTKHISEGSNRTSYANRKFNAA